MNRHVVLDTGPLLEFLIRRYEREFNRSWPDRTVQFFALGHPADVKTFAQFLLANRGLVKTTAGVVAELHRRVQAAGQQVVGPGFWDLATREFGQLRIEERALPLRLLSPPIVAELGPVDAGVLEVARSLVREGRRATVLDH